jgi:lactoylglutathione lyase
MGLSYIIPNELEAGMKAIFKNAWPYKDDKMNLPVANVEAAVPFYVDIMGFEVVSWGDSPHRSAVLARPDIEIGLAENGGDPTQEGCAFEVDNVETAFAEFKANGLEKGISDFSTETNNGTNWKVFYIVAPDGLCYWLGEKQVPLQTLKD